MSISCLTATYPSSPTQVQTIPLYQIAGCAALGQENLLIIGLGLSLGLKSVAWEEGSGGEGAVADFLWLESKKDSSLGGPSPSHTSAGHPGSAGMQSCLHFLTKRCRKLLKGFVSKCWEQGP